jgi:hypothetical protein
MSGADAAAADARMDWIEATLASLTKYSKNNNVQSRLPYPLPKQLRNRVQDYSRNPAQPAGPVQNRSSG